MGWEGGGIGGCQVPHLPHTSNEPTVHIISVYQTPIFLMIIGHPTQPTKNSKTILTLGWQVPTYFLGFNCYYERKGMKNMKNGIAYSCALGKIRENMDLTGVFIILFPGYEYA